MDKLWINKYKPSTLNDVIGHKQQISKIKNWLSNINTFKNRAIVISGVHGIGKSLTIKLLLSELNYLIRIIHPNEIKDHRIFDDFNDYYNHQNSIYSKINFSDEEKKQLVLIFEETENISLTSEKKYIMDIFKENNKLKAFPLIFIANNQHSKLLNDLKKNCEEIKFECPNITELCKLIHKICLNENIKIQNDDVLCDLIHFSQYDIRRLINLLQELSFHYKIIDKNNLDIFIEKSREKNIDTGLFDATNKILNNYLDYDTIMKLYEFEKVLLPLMIHENYLRKVLYKSKDEWPTVLYDLVKISDSISRGDNIETSIYTDQNWYLQNIHGFYTCLNTSYWINKNNKSYTIENKNIKFSADLNKTSLKNINRKNITNLLKIFPNKSIYDILILNKISNYLLVNNFDNDLIEILSKYIKDVTVKEIELCLKIDKTSEFKLLNSKDKKKITKMIKN
uniref:DNA replication factor RFC1 C-terminal domain-containing protein n=1 Tax=viral metagenome TaxID=1070528 RepID=A0A6C0D9K0_9ZZZZ